MSAASEGQPVADDPRLTRLLELSRSLPESGREAFGEHTRIVVRGKTYAWFANDHHGDGVVGAIVKAGQDQADALIAAEPDRFYRPAYLGHKGWVGLRLDVGPIDWDEVRDLMAESYLLIAPKRLAALVRAT